MAESEPTGDDAGGPAWDPDGYRGTVATNVAVPGLSSQPVVTAVDLWTHAVELRGTAVTDPARPFWFRGLRGLTTDLGSTHTDHGGGGGSLTWHYCFVPSLPAGATELRILVGPEGDRSAGGDDLRPEPAVTIPLPGAPPTVRRTAAVLDATPAGPGAPGDGERSPGPPARVIAVSTALDGAGERDLCVLAVDVWPSWFAVHIGGGGPLSLPPMEGATHRLLGRGWSAVDDRGGRYAGRTRSAHSGFPWTATGTLAPALDPEARELTLTFPFPFASGTVTAKVDLQ